MAEPGSPPQQQNALVNPIMVHFLHGQYANLFKFALWWTTLAPLTFALFNQDATAIGVGRIVYNVALCVLSPLGGIVCERFHPRKVLLGAASVRFTIWCVLVPGMWLLFDSTLVATSQLTIWVLFNLFLMMDGAAVALSTVLDIDLCGVDICAGRFGFEVTDEQRNQFNGRQELFFAACFTLFTPGMAFLGLAIHEAFQQARSVIPPNALEAGTLVGIFFVTFAVATVLQFYYFKKLPDDPAPKQPLPEAMSAYSLDDKREAVIQEHSAATEPQPPTACAALRSVPSDLLEALRVIWAHPPILFRLVFLGLEIAFEDAAIVVIASQMGIALPWLGDRDSVNGNIWTSVGVASGKLGGATASLLMIKWYHPPEEPRKFLPIFVLILLSCAAITVFPAIVDGVDNGVLSPNAARALFLIGFFVYFFLSTLPKLGLMCLFQSMVSQVENGPRVFGFVAIVATTFDALVVMGLSIVFVRCDSVRDALWITTYIYLAHGVLEMIIGPLFVLRPLQAAADGQHRPCETSETSRLTNASGGTNVAEAPTAPQAGTYTQRSASILVGVPAPPSSPRLATSHRAAFLSTSHTATAGSVARKFSGMSMEPTSPVQACQGSSAIAIGDGAPKGSPREPPHSGSWLGGVSATGRLGASYTRQGSRLAPMANK